LIRTTIRAYRRTMPADAPTILATSGGIGPGLRTRFEFTALTDLAVDLSGVTGRAPRICFLATALGDDKSVLHHLTEAAENRGFSASHVSLFPMPTVEDITAHLLDQDVVWVFGGSVAGLLAMWRLHGVDAAMHAAWQAGVVLTGISAGSICWHTGGTTDSFGPQLRPITNGLGFVPYANGVHYNSEPQRRPLLHSLVGERVLPAAYATDDGAGILYRGTAFVEAVAENDCAGAYFVEARDGVAVETALDVRRL
jgi:peptidase E